MTETNMAVAEETVIAVTATEGPQQEEKHEYKDFVDSSTFDTAGKLLNALKFLKKGYSSNPVVPILENVYFRNNVMYMGDLETFFAHATSIKGEFLVPFKNLFDVLSKLKDKSTKISFSFNVKNCKVSLSLNGKESFHFSSQHILDYPKIYIPLNKVGAFNIKDIEAVKSVLQFASKDCLRPHLNGVYIERECFTATDGHRLKMYKAEPVLTDGEPNFIINPKVAKCIDEFESIYIKRLERDPRGQNGETTKINHYSFSDHEKAIIFRPVGERFPDYRNVIPQKHYIEISVVRKDLIEIVDLALISANKTTSQIQFLPRLDHTMEVGSEDIDFGSEFRNEIHVVVTCLEREGFLTTLDEDGNQAKDSDGCVIQEKKMIMTEPFGFGFNGKFLSELLKSHTEDIVVLKGEAANRAFMIGDTSLIMPIMLNQYL